LYPDEQQRILAATIDGMRIVCAYVPNGQAVDSDKYAYKLGWMASLRDWLAGELARHPGLAVLGDYNVAPEDRDVHDPAAWEGEVHLTPRERAAFQALLDVGLADAYRLFPQPEKTYSWWDYRMLRFQKNQGLRIDHILLSPPLAARCTGCTIDRAPRKWKQPSDHAPVIATLA
jgi:exodeoxyribonuclease-3